MIVDIAIQYDFACSSYCVSASGSDTWPRLVHERKEHDSYCIGSLMLWFAINCFIHINYRLFMTYVHSMVKAPACLSKLSSHAARHQGIPCSNQAL